MSSTSTPSTSELVEGVLFYPVALVVSATILPGMTLAIPGLIFAAAFILIPLAAVALVVLVVASVIAAPFVAVRAIRARLVAKPRDAAPAIEGSPRVSVAA